MVEESNSGGETCRCAQANEATYSPSADSDTVISIGHVHIYHFPQNSSATDQNKTAASTSKTTTEAQCLSKNSNASTTADPNSKKVHYELENQRSPVPKIFPPSMRHGSRFTSSGGSKSTRNSSSAASSSSNHMCRICHEGDICEDLLSPCNCSGSMGLVHGSCLEIWLTTSNNTCCEICHKTYRIEKKPKSFKEWIMLTKSSMEHRNRVGDLICFLLLLPVAICSCYLCLQAACSKKVWENHWEAGGLIFLTTFFVSTFLVWTVVSLRYHIILWRNWRIKNQNIRLLSLTDSSRISSNGDEDDTVFLEERLAPTAREQSSIRLPSSNRNDERGVSHQPSVPVTPEYNINSLYHPSVFHL